MAFDYMHPPEDFEYLGEWCKAWRDPATGDWTISQLLDGLDTEQIILSGEEVRELARLAAQHDPCVLASWRPLCERCFSAV